MSSSIAGALSTLSDRGLRRLLGARTFLRGLDYEKRKVVGDLKAGRLIVGDGCKILGRLDINSESMTASDGSAPAKAPEAEAPVDALDKVL